MSSSLFGDTSTVISANVYNSIAALRFINSLISNTAYVFGYYTPGDGGGGNYYLDVSDITSTDNGGTVIVSVDGGRWKLVYTNFVSVKQFGAKGDGVTDDTTRIQALVNTGIPGYIPKSIYIVSGRSGIVIKGGTVLFGDGKPWSVLLSDGTGASVAELITYNLGSMIRRQWNVTGPNTYINNVVLRDFAVIITHPSNAVTTTAIQIAVDLRNITRSTVERVHVGNITPINCSVQRTFTGNFEVQGYGILNGNVSSGLTGVYAGGECNKVIDCSAWGAYKLITNDDEVLSAFGSSAHNFTVQNCDIQGGQTLLSQESGTTTACNYFNNTIQNAKQQPGSSGSTYIVRCEGYNNQFIGGYIEAGNATTYLCYFGTNSHNNNFKFTYYSATSAALFTDLGRKNTCERFENSGSISGGVDSAGRTIVIYDRAYKNMWAQFRWNGSAVVIDDSVGISSITRNTIGDYTITFKFAYQAAIFGVSGLFTVDSSGHSGNIVVSTVGVNNVRIFTYEQNNAVTTQIDPTNIWIKIEN